MRGRRPWRNPTVFVSTDQLFSNWLVFNIGSWRCNIVLWRRNIIRSYLLTKCFNNVLVPWLHNCYGLLFIVIIIIVSLRMLPHVYQIIVFLILLVMLYFV